MCRLMWGVVFLGVWVGEWGGGIEQNLGKGRVGNIGWGVGSLCQLKQSNNQSYETI